MCEMKSLDGSNPPLSANESPISGASQHAAIARVWGFIGCVLNVNYFCRSATIIFAGCRQVDV
jgi:hypothetical protein